MNPDDPVCLCFHVTRRKIQSFIRVEKPKRPSQLSECFGAGTGCGWCRPFLERMLIQALEQSDSTSNPQPNTPDPDPANRPANEAGSANVGDLTFEEYKLARSKYVRDGGGTPPPGATPIEGQDNG